MTMTSPLRVLVLALLVLLAASHHAAQPADAFTFSMSPGTTKCFTDELSTSHRVHLDYAMPKARAIFTYVYLTGPDGATIYEEKRSSNKAHYVWHPQKQGEYAVCFQSSEKRPPVQSFDVTLTLLAEYEVNTQKSLEYMQGEKADAGNQKNKALMVQARYAQDNLASIHEEFRAHMEREAHMRVTTESAFTRAGVMSFISVLIITAVSYLGYLTLKRHLYKKKILE